MRETLFYVGHLICVSIPIFIYFFWDIVSAPREHVPLKIFWAPFLIVFCLRTSAFGIAMKVRNTEQLILNSSRGNSFFKGMGLGLLDLIVMAIVGLPFYLLDLCVPSINFSAIWLLVIFITFTVISLYCTVVVSRMLLKLKGTKGDNTD